MAGRPVDHQPRRAGLGVPDGRAMSAHESPRLQRTLGDLHCATPWLCLHCEKCQHYAPLACAVPVSAGAPIERQATAVRPLHGMRPQRRDNSASGMGRRRYRLPAGSNLAEVSLLPASISASAKPGISASAGINARNRTFTEVTLPTLTGCRPNRAPRRCGHRRPSLAIQSKFRIPIEAYRCALAKDQDAASPLKSQRVVPAQ